MLFFFRSTDRLRNGSADLARRRASSRGIIPKAKVKTVKMTIVIVIVFVLCWSPYIVFDLLQVFEQIPRTQTNIAIATFIQSLAPLNSAANPLIYCLFSTHFVRTLKYVHVTECIDKSINTLLFLIRTEDFHHSDGCSRQAGVVLLRKMSILTMAVDRLVVVDYETTTAVIP